MSKVISRKRAIALLNHPPAEACSPRKRQYPPRRYNESVQAARVTVWKAANRICSTRLAPFLPEFVAALERLGHLSLEKEVRDRLLSVSAASAG
ncbi:MAG TPA: hypothetical protein VFB38_12600 [Chthonomonadaceae bacterium]|nr:hypothetical protein [Chthonomonadaceae bacterium]